MSVSVIPVKSPHPHPCHYTIRAHCFEFVYRPIPTSWKSPYHSHIIRVLNHKSRLKLPPASRSQHQLIKAFIFFAHLHIASSHSPCPQPSLLCHFGAEQSPALLACWPTQQTDILLSAGPDGKGVISGGWGMILIVCGYSGSLTEVFP